MPRLNALVVLILFCAVSIPLTAQAPGTGLYPFGTFDNRGFDSINVGNLNVHFEIPIVSKPGRGSAFNYKIVYDGLIWSAAGASGSQYWVPGPNWGFHGVFGEGVTGYVTFDTNTLGCTPPRLGRTQTNYEYLDSSGGRHIFNYSFTVPCSGGATTTGDGSTSDGSGYSFDGTNVHDATGKTIAVPVVNSTALAIGFTGVGSVTDSNGNVITGSGSASSGNYTYTDTLGSTALTVSGYGNDASPRILAYNVAQQADGSTTASVTMSYSLYTIQTNFGCGISASSTQTQLVNRITLADGTYYQFTYEPTPGVSGAVTGRLASVTLPTGGTINYQYSGDCGGAINADGTPGSLTRITSDGTRTYTRTAVNSSYPYYTYKTLVQDEANNQTLYQISSSQFGVVYETHRQVYQGNVGGTPLLDRQTCYNGIAAPCEGFGVGLPIIETTVTSSLNGGASKQTVDDYDQSSGFLTNESLYDYGGSLIQKTTNSYVAPGGVSSIVVQDGANNTISSVSYGYDESTPTTTSGIPQHSGGSTGNQTSSHAWINTSNSWIDTTTAYYDTGVPVSSTGPNGTTQYAYDSTQGFATQVTPPTPSSGVSLPSYASFDVSSGAQISASDANYPSNAQVQVTQYDRQLRPTVITDIDGSKTEFYYFSANNYSIFNYQTTTDHSNTGYELDSFGRMSRQAVLTGRSTNPWNQIDYCYDATGKLQFQSTTYAGPAFGTPKHCSGSGTIYTYDALGRVTNINNADGNATYQYSSRAVKVTDVNGVQKITQHDALGRITAVCEVSSTSYQGGSPQNCGLDIAGTGYLTTYAYDLFNHKTTITQGAQQRIFQTDSLGRTIYTKEPERGETTYSYAYNSLGLQVIRTRPSANSNPTNPQTSTTTQYDKAGRPLNISYSDGMSPRIFQYDQTTNWGTVSLGASKGKLTFASVGGLGTQFTYDSMGRITFTVECLPGLTCGVNDTWHSYNYDLTGNITSESFYASSALSLANTYTYSPAGELTSLSDNRSGSIISNMQSSPFGPVSFSLGNGLSTASTYDGMGRLWGRWLCSGSTQQYCTGGTQFYGFDAYTQGSRILGLDDTVLGTHADFGYDEFNRLTGANYTFRPQQVTFTYDRYGNRLSQSITGTGVGAQPNFSVDTASNHILTSGYVYDAAGNLINDPNHSYTYDAEGNLILVDGGSTAIYIYDALNHRVRSQENGVVQEYSYNLNGQRIAVFDAYGNTVSNQLYWGQTPVAFYQGGQIHYQHQDWLGTERMRTASNGSVEGTYQSLPFGDGFLSSGADNDTYHFAQLDHDAGSNTEHAQFRQYSSFQGRWMSPDPYSGSYDGSDPQSFNRYVYARNNPLAIVDPSGLSGVCVYGFPSFNPEDPSIDPFIYNSYDCSSAYGTWVETGSDVTMDVNSNDPLDPYGPGIGAIAVSPSSPNSNDAPSNPAPKNGWGWDEKPHWPTPPATPAQPFTDCFNGAMKQSAPPGKNTVTVLTTLTGLLNVISPNPVTKTVNATNALFNLSRITAAALVCSGGDAYFEP